MSLQHFPSPASGHCTLAGRDRILGGNAEAMASGWATALRLGLWATALCLGGCHPVGGDAEPHTMVERPAGKDNLGTGDSDGRGDGTP